MVRSDKISFFTTTNILILLAMANLIFTGGIFSYVNFSNQVSDNTTADLKALVKAIDRSDQTDDNRTEYLLNRTVAASIRNYIQLVDTTKQVINGTNATNTLVKFLSDNFGSNSGYLERENFQYDQANKTFDYLGRSLENQMHIIDLLNNLTHHIYNNTNPQMER